MASAFAHIVIPIITYATLKSRHVSLRLFFLAAALSIFPDIDVIAFELGIPYESQWGHRGFTHSLAFAFGIALFAALFKHPLRSHPLAIFCLCFIACSSHALLDAMTNGGLGVALYWPFDHSRVFLPFRPIQVSPIGLAEFFTSRGLNVLSSELFWVFLPGTILSIIGILLRRKHQKNNNSLSKTS
jgi:inner membrane protein